MPRERLRGASCRIRMDLRCRSSTSALAAARGSMLRALVSTRVPLSRVTCHRAMCSSKMPRVPIRSRTSNTCPVPSAIATSPPRMTLLPGHTVALWAVPSLLIQEVLQASGLAGGVKFHSRPIHAECPAGVSSSAGPAGSGAGSHGAVPFVCSSVFSVESGVLLPSLGCKVEHATNRASASARLPVSGSGHL